jgi:hypothetical protein
MRRMITPAKYTYMAVDGDRRFHLQYSVVRKQITEKLAHCPVYQMKEHRGRKEWEGVVNRASVFDRAG